MRLRQSTSDGEPAFPRVRYDLPDCARNILRIHNQTEFSTIDELRKIIPLEVFRQTGQCYSHNCAPDLHYQAILMSLRILSQFQSDMRPASFFLHHVMKYLPFLMYYQPRFIQPSPINFNTTRLIIEVSTFLKSQDVDDRSWPFHFVETIFDTGLDFEINYAMAQKEFSLENLGLFNFTNIMKILYILSVYVEKLPLETEDFRRRNKTLRVIYNAIGYLAKNLLKNLKEEESQQFWIWLSRFVRVTEDQCVANPRFIRVKSLLHIACERYPHQLYTEIIKMLLEAGADPNLSDGDCNNTPAHCVAKNYFSLEFLAQITSLELLVEAGAHLNRVNKHGRTALEDFRRCFQDHPNELVAIESINDNKSCLASDVRLTCLCADVLRRNRVVYDVEKYPPLLVPFLESHGAKTRIQRM